MTRGEITKMKRNLIAQAANMAIEEGMISKERIHEIAHGGKATAHERTLLKEYCYLIGKKDVIEAVFGKY